LLQELLYFEELRKDVLGTLAQRFAVYGDVYYSSVRGHGAFSAMDPEFIHAVLVTKASSFRRRTIDLEFLGNGVLTSHGEDWRRRRRRLNPGFRHDMIAGYAALMRAEVEGWLGGLEAGTHLELHESMRDLTLRIVCSALFGQQFGGDARELGRATRILQEAVLRPKILPPWVPTPYRLRHRYMSRLVDRQVYAIIDRGESAPGSLLSALRTALDAGEPASREELRDEVVTLLLAGHETTALALTWAFYLIALHPKIDERIAEELERVTGGETPDHRHFERLEFTRRVLDETMRLYPPVYVVPRVCIEPVKVGGYWISPGNEVWLWSYFMHRDARWFSLPDRFDPDRFLSRAQSAHSLRTYLPFGAGMRSCIGQGFATLEAVLVIAAVLQRFRPELTDARPVYPHPRITLSPGRAVRVRMHARRAGSS
jgi:cytochrome P450